MAAEDRAKNLLNHYLQMALARTGVKCDNDTTMEIDSIVEEIVEAAVEECARRMTSKGR